jgi:hypothetical protein
MKSKRKKGERLVASLNAAIPAEALKALPPDGIEYVHTLLQDFWEGRRIYEEWQTVLL